MRATHLEVMSGNRALVKPGHADGNAKGEVEQGAEHHGDDEDYEEADERAFGSLRVQLSVSGHHDRHPKRASFRTTRLHSFDFLRISSTLCRVS